jgi:hypothetical protein
VPWKNKLSGKSYIFTEAPLLDIPKVKRGRGKYPGLTLPFPPVSTNAILKKYLIGKEALEIIQKSSFSAVQTGEGQEMNLKINRHWPPWFQTAH